jgi:eukaryotic-like serine/threonine-protein kinase
MDVSNVAPFSNVECPTCQKHTRVKREFGPYTLLRRHAIGGMSMVFVGHDNTLDREVALKILSEDYSADEKRITAFEEEARITAAISHPHVVRVFKTGKAFGRFYIAMELVAGGHLEHQIRERSALPEAESLRLAIEVAEGLRAAYSAGLIHRDIKPGNILLDSAGSAKIVDFGLALMTKGGVATPDELWATPFYVPPETIEGLEEDYRTDVYAFGATFYHVLAGKPPCTEESMVTSQLREAKKHIVPLSMACPHLAMETCAIIECAMAYEPNARFSSYDELIENLNTALMVVTTRDKNIRKGIAPAPRVPIALAVTAADRRNLLRQQRNQKIFGVAIILILISVITVVAIKLTGKKTTAPDDADPSTPTGDAPFVSDNSGVEIGNFYQQARQFQQKGDYTSARRAFNELLNNPRVQEPTRTWCGFESMLASLLEGNTRNAYDDATLLANHLKQPNVAPGTRNRLGPWLDAMRGLPHIPQPLSSERPENDLIYLMTAMASGCKNWEQGKIAEALTFFEIVNVTPSKNSQSFIGLYQTKALKYLADAKTLKANDPYPLPNNPAECRAKATALEEVARTITTRGRAKFNIRAWQLDLERQARRLEAAQSAATNQKPYTENRPAILAYSSACRYRDAVELAKKSKVANNQEGAELLSLIALNDRARDFIRDLERDLKTAPLSYNLQSKDGRTFTRILNAGEDMVTLANGETETTLAWSALKPADVIAIYREAIKRNTPDSNINRRHENAICFQWLSGEKDAALNAANVLSNSVPAFKTRWEIWMKSIK